jgi:NAD(P)-dependent dehydrogenase (short-subunit alcohol dehydrogenase family)
LLTPYAMSKAGLLGLSTSLRLEAARYDVKVRVACPGLDKELKHAGR